MKKRIEAVEEALCIVRDKAGVFSVKIPDRASYVRLKSFKEAGYEQDLTDLLSGLRKNLRESNVVVCSEEVKALWSGRMPALKALPKGWGETPDPTSEPTEDLT
jgi:hypothetical protein